jgi:hypothetical protein
LSFLKFSERKMRGKNHTTFYAFANIVVCSLNRTKCNFAPKILQFDWSSTKSVKFASPNQRQPNIILGVICSLAKFTVYIFITVNNCMLQNAFFFFKKSLARDYHSKIFHLAFFFFDAIIKNTFSNVNRENTN